MKKENGKKNNKVTRPTPMIVSARYKGTSRKKTYFLYDLWKDEDDNPIEGNEIFGTLYVPKEMAGNIPKIVEVHLSGNISTLHPPKE